MDDLDPHYCTRCRKQISRERSEQQRACEDCAATRNEDVQPTMRTQAGPSCPRCGSADVAEEWTVGFGATLLYTLWQVIRWILWVALWWSTWWADWFGPDAAGADGSRGALRRRCRRCRKQWRPI